ncbi:hypothetical protein DSO57_1010062 [Entomophthora muscae]|uniref:Uncharacterized protein n=2 Tax=Entomophthora muscae TaxID=34485 RepID=A0ACC2SJD6_9FUNG|nr:hypothetical protein DSO57_1022164 [Entomophthora muscae]KAJ9062491.1 hypothetical protein DSO57_1010062 [Entomophthora muscae]
MSFQFFDTNPIRHRSKLTQREFNILESLFQQDSNPRLVIRRNLARQMGMRQRTIQIWFQNRRAKAIRLNEPISHSTPISPTLQAMAPHHLYPTHRSPNYSCLKISEFWATTMSCIKYYRY